MAKNKKTNAMRLLEKEGIAFETISYENRDGKIDGVSVAAKIGRSPEYVFKTLVTEGSSGEHYVFVIPANEELNLKKAAKAAGEKKVQMIHVKDILGLTGYIRGGCSPIGMKKHFKTFIDESAGLLDKIVVSGGMIGLQMEIESKSLLFVAKATLVDVAD
ncbi:MAG: Cys-tRNA(Pro) deacylase [Peptostreptococcaceae bacterium]|nr:Cys-tRNA(Pro) deacylase [Peptostreptococcaceae bacterium]